MRWDVVFLQLRSLERGVKDVIMSDASMSLEQYASFTDCWEKLHDINMLLKEWDSDNSADLKRRLINEAFEADDAEAEALNRGCDAYHAWKDDQNV